MDLFMSDSGHTNLEMKPGKLDESKIYIGN